MKKFLFYFSLMVSISLPSCSDSRHDMERSLTQIYRMDVRRIDLITGTDGGGDLYCYYAGDSLKMMSLRVMLSNYVAVDTLFYKDGSLVGFRRESFSDPDHSIATNEPFSQADYVVDRGKIRLVSESGLKQPEPSIGTLVEESNLLRSCAECSDTTADIEGWIKGTN